MSNRHSILTLTGYFHMKKWLVADSGECWDLRLFLSCGGAMSLI